MRAQVNPVQSEQSSLSIHADILLDPRPGALAGARWLPRVWRCLPASYVGRVTLGLVLFAAVWLSELAASSLTAPMDNVEQLTWVRSLQWGYYKHPPLPTWLLWPVVHFFGAAPVDTYVLGASVTLAALGLYAWLLVLMRGRAYATLALLAALCITFYNGRLHYYNHNTVLMLFVTASALASWQAFRLRSLAWWAALGLMLGLGGLSKYQIAVSAVSVAVVWVQQRGWRDATHRRGAWLAAGVAGLTMLPHLLWLVQSDFQPIHYAMSTSLGVAIPWVDRWHAVMHWLADELFNRLLPAWLLLALALTTEPPGQALAQGGAAPKAKASGGLGLTRSLLLAFGIVPLAFMAAIGLLFGSELQLQWGTAFAPFAVPAATELLAMRKSGATLSLRRATIAFVGIQILLLSVNWFTSAKAPARWQSAHWCRFPSAQLAQELAGPARRALGGPVRIIDGPSQLAGALALQLPEQPWVLIDGRPDISPWVPADELSHSPVLQLRVYQGTLDPAWQAVGADFPGLAWRVRWPDEQLEG